MNNIPINQLGGLAGPGGAPITTTHGGNLPQPNTSQPSLVSGFNGGPYQLTNPAAALLHTYGQQNPSLPGFPGGLPSNPANAHSQGAPNPALQNLTGIASTQAGPVPGQPQQTHISHATHHTPGLAAGLAGPASHYVLQSGNQSHLLPSFNLSQPQINSSFQHLRGDPNALQSVLGPNLNANQVNNLTSNMGLQQPGQHNPAQISLGHLGGPGGPGGQQMPNQGQPHLGSHQNLGMQMQNQGMPFNQR